MKLEKYRFSRMRSQKSICLGILVGSALMAASGCRGTPLSFPQSLSGGAAARVPSPSTGSFQVPGTYSGPSTTSSTGLGNSSFSPTNSVSGAAGFSSGQTPQSVNNFVNGISSAQTQFRTATNNALGAVNRAADGLNTRVESATARVDRFGEGVKQASAILNEAATAPQVPPTFTASNSGSPAPSNSSSTGFIASSTGMTAPAGGLPTSFPPPPGAASTSLPSSGRIGDAPSDASVWRTPTGN